MEGARLNCRDSDSGTMWLFFISLRDLKIKSNLSETFPFLDRFSTSIYPLVHFPLTDTTPDVQENQRMYILSQKHLSLNILTPNSGKITLVHSQTSGIDFIPCLINKPSDTTNRSCCFYPFAMNEDTSQHLASLALENIHLFLQPH